MANTRPGPQQAVSVVSACLGAAGAALGVAALWLSAVTGPEFDADYWTLRDATETSIDSLWLWVIATSIAALIYSVPPLVTGLRPRAGGLQAFGGFGLILSAALLLSVPVRTLAEIRYWNDQSREAGYDPVLDPGFGILAVTLAAGLMAAGGVVALVQSHRGAAASAPLQSGPPSTWMSDVPGLVQLFLTAGGRIGRARYWFAAVVTTVIIVPAEILIALAGSPGLLVGLLLYLFAVPPSVCASVKRWHDRNKSAWWVVLSLVPLVGWVWSFVENGCLSGDPAANRYGAPDPIVPEAVD